MKLRLPKVSADSKIIILIAAVFTGVLYMTMKMPAAGSLDPSTGSAVNETGVNVSSRALKQTPVDDDDSNNKTHALTKENVSEFDGANSSDYDPEIIDALITGGLLGDYTSPDTSLKNDSASNNITKIS